MTAQQLLSRRQEEARDGYPDDFPRIDKGHKEDEDDVRDPIHSHSNVCSLDSYQLSADL